jgi:type III restriction enzyme
MQNNERLLSMDEALRFIFSHSALKEGWDNPNVFQICSLREMGTNASDARHLGAVLDYQLTAMGIGYTTKISIN